MNATGILLDGHHTALQAIEGFPAPAWETPGACGLWSVKDIIAHLASYEQVLVDVLTGFVAQHPHPTPSLDKFTELCDQFNDTEVETRKKCTMQEVLTEFNNAHAQVLELAAHISPAMFTQPGTLPWYGIDYSLDDVLVHMYYGHQREHSAQITAFR